MKKFLLLLGSMLSSKEKADKLHTAFNVNPSARSMRNTKEKAKQKTKKKNNSIALAGVLLFVGVASVLTCYFCYKPDTSSKPIPHSQQFQSGNAKPKSNPSFAEGSPPPVSPINLNPSNPLPPVVPPTPSNPLPPVAPPHPSNPLPVVLSTSSSLAQSNDPLCIAVENFTNKWLAPCKDLLESLEKSPEMESVMKVIDMQRSVVQVGSRFAEGVCSRVDVVVDYLARQLIPVAAPYVFDELQQLNDNREIVSIGIRGGLGFITNDKDWIDNIVNLVDTVIISLHTWKDETVELVRALCAEEFSEECVEDLIKLTDEQGAYGTYACKDIKDIKRDINWENINKKNALEAVKISAWSLTRLPQVLQNDEEVVLAAMSKYSYILRDANEKFKKDKAFILKAIKDASSFCFMDFIDKSLLEDRDIVLAALGKNGSFLNHLASRRDIKIPTNFLDDEEIIRAAISNYGPALRHASTRLRQNSEIVLMALKNGFHLTELTANVDHDRLLVDASLLANRNIALEAVKRRPSSLKVLTRFQDDTEVVNAAISNGNGWLFKYASNNMKENRDMLLTAITNGYCPPNYRDLLHDKVVVLKALEGARFHADKFVPEILQQYTGKDFLLKAISNGYIPPNYDMLLDDKELAIAFVQGGRYGSRHITRFQANGFLPEILKKCPERADNIITYLVKFHNFDIWSMDKESLSIFISSGYLRFSPRLRNAIGKFGAAVMVSLSKCKSSILYLYESEETQHIIKRIKDKKHQFWTWTKGKLENFFDFCVKKLEEKKPPILLAIGTSLQALTSNASFRRDFVDVVDIGINSLSSCKKEFMCIVDALIAF